MPAINKKLAFVCNLPAALTLLSVGLPAGAAQAAQYFAKPTLSTYANISAEFSFQHSETLLPAQPGLAFQGTGGLILQRGLPDRGNQAEVFIQDPANQLQEAKVIAEAPTKGGFLAEVQLIDLNGKSFDLFISPDKAHLPTVVQSTRSFDSSLNVSAGADYNFGQYKAGVAVSFDVDDLKQANSAELGSALLYVGSDQLGTLRFGRNLSLPFGTRDPQVISGGSFSFADFGKWQVSYVSPIWNGFRTGVLAGKSAEGKLSFAGMAQYQTTYGDNQFRVGGYADSAKSWQALAGYTYRYAPEGFAGLSARYGRDGGLEGFASLEATVQHQKHFFSASAERVWSNNLDLLYANDNQPFFSVSIRDTAGFNREDRFSLGYSYTLNRNFQLFANARYIRHKFYESRKELSAGLRVAF